ncbi:MAG: hypothetical protein KC645_14815 [Gemmatimonadetes bacterium]|nr:hypothetical protein [Gemmatimonadota bacterium]
MQRWNLPEIEDQPWCPAWLREAMTGYLQTVIGLTRPYASAAPAVADLLRASGSAQIVDLCSGAGGPWPDLGEAVEREVGHDVEIVLTDLHPNPGTIERAPRTRYIREPVSALAVPSGLVGVRTLFTALHHFSPAQVETLLSTAQQDRAAFGAFEATHRSVKGMLITCLIPLLVLVFMPRVRPLRWQTVVFTYLIPLIPVAIWWDGMASTLRTYRAEEIETILRTLPSAPFRWSVREVPVDGAPVPMLQVIGQPTGS